MLLLVVLALPAVTAAPVTVVTTVMASAMTAVTAAMTVAGSATKPRTAFRRFPPGPARECWWSLAEEHDPIGAFMIRPVIAALPALAAPGLLVAPAAR